MLTQPNGHCCIMACCCNLFTAVNRKTVAKKAQNTELHNTTKSYLFTGKWQWRFCSASDIFNAGHNAFLQYDFHFTLFLLQYLYSIYWGSLEFTNDKASVGSICKVCSTLCPQALIELRENLQHTNHNEWFLVHEKWLNSLVSEDRPCRQNQQEVPMYSSLMTSRFLSISS